MSVAHGQRIILAVPEITAATLVGSDSHVGEELLPAPEPAAIVGRHDRHDPLLAGGRATERLADNEQVALRPAPPDIVALDGHADLEVGHVERLRVERAPLGKPLVDGQRETRRRRLELCAGENLSVKRGNLELHLAHFESLRDPHGRMPIALLATCVFL